MLLVEGIGLWFKSYSKILLLSFVLCAINVLIYLSFLYGFVKFNDEVIYYTSPVVEEEKQLRRKQGGYITIEQSEALNKKMEEGLKEFSQRHDVIHKEKSLQEIARIKRVTMFLALIIWALSFFFLSGKLGEIFPVLFFPYLFSLAGVLPFFNLFVVSGVVGSVVMYKRIKGI